MFYKELTRLTLVRFLGIFGGSKIEVEDGDKNEKCDLPAHLEKFSPKTPNVKISRDKTAINLSRKKITSFMIEKGIPGMTVCVSRRGEILWNSGFGLCDVENNLECAPEALLRIASISKPLFVSTIIGPMIDKNQIDIDSSVYKHLTHEEFPKQKYKGKEKDITIKQLMSHTGGIRSYNDGGCSGNDPLKPIASKDSLKIYQCDDQFNRKDFYQRQTYRSVIEALEPFKNSELVNEPGKYSYTTYGYTLLSAVVEKVHQQQGETDKERQAQIEDWWMKVLRRDWDLKETRLDQDEPILSNRARYYLRNAINGTLTNAPYVDNSVKWAGGGIVSTARDLVKFANAMIDSYKGRDGSKLSRKTVELLWKEVQASYALGYIRYELNPSESGGEKFAASHLGGAVGASSAMIIFPETEIVVVILCNLGCINLKELGIYIANRFVESN